MAGRGPVRLGEGARTALRPAAEARIDGGFWAERRRVNAEVSIPEGPDHLEEAGNLHNLRLAAGAVEGEFIGGYPFQDSDVHKWLEAASWRLQDAPDPALESHVDDIIGLLAAAQREDGYLQTYYQTHAEKKPWTELGWGHELYCAGHLIQAAVAHHRSTGKATLLDVARRFADHIDTVFGADKEIDGVCGHPEIETALVELYRETGERRYLALAEYFVDRRGHGVLKAAHHAQAVYWQDDVPVRETRTVAGHAVRHLYLLAGATDIAMETGEPALREAMTRVWEDMAATKLYVTGGAGARHEGEAFGDAYELPSERAYAETCAAIASVHWGWRMALMTGEARYSDLVERTLYNGFLAGVSLDGRRWLYVNPLQVREGYAEGHEDSSVRRREWFGCACCPPNVMRLLASLPHYCSTVDDEGLQLHQYATGRYGDAGLAVAVATGYPHDGRVVVTVEETRDAEWTLSLRIPAWCSGYEVTVGGEAVSARAADDGWLRLRRRWASGETVALDLDVAARFTVADRRVDAVRGCVAIERGPLVYCVEETDAGVGLDAVAVDPAAGLREEERAELLGGVTVVTATGAAPADGVPGWPYGVAGAGTASGEAVALPAVPYYAWANREAGSMRVWLPVG